MFRSAKSSRRRPQQTAKGGATASQNSVRLSPFPSHGMVPLQQPQLASLSDRQPCPKHHIASRTVQSTVKQRPATGANFKWSHWVIFSVNSMQSPAFPSTRCTGASASFQSACLCDQRLSAHCVRYLLHATLVFTVGEWHHMNHGNTCVYGVRSRYWLPMPGMSRSLAMPAGMCDPGHAPKPPSPAPTSTSS